MLKPCVVQRGERRRAFEVDWVGSQVFSPPSAGGRSVGRSVGRAVGRGERTRSNGSENRATCMESTNNKGEIMTSFWLVDCALCMADEHQQKARITRPTSSADNIWLIIGKAVIGDNIIIIIMSLVCDNRLRHHN